MCIVLVNKLGVQFPDVKKIQNCCENNPDGFSMAWNEDCKVKNFKTMSQKEMIKFYRKFVDNHEPDKTAFIFHARIATHGSLKLSNCHCWIENGIAFAHNGILTIKNRGDMTDSETFFRDIFMPCVVGGGWEAGLKAVNACIGASKFAFLNGEGVIAHFGIFNKDKDGNLYSNHTYSYSTKDFGAGYYEYGFGGASNYHGYYPSSRASARASSSEKKSHKSTLSMTDDEWLDAYKKGELDF